MALSADLRTALRDRPLVLDGGLGTRLEARGNDLSGRLWSARLLRDDPDEVRAAHAEFVDAGADVLVTSSYQLAYGVGLDDDEVDELLRRSVVLAREAGEVFVAASVGPFGAVRADGSEYTGAYDVDVDALRAFHRRRLAVLADAGADALAIETIPSRLEVQALVAELDRLGRPDLPVWISLSAASSGFAGADLAAALADAAAVPGVVAVGVNCRPRLEGRWWCADGAGESVDRGRRPARRRLLPHDSGAHLGAGGLDALTVAVGGGRRVRQMRPLRTNARYRPSSSIAAVT